MDQQNRGQQSTRIRLRRAERSGQVPRAVCLFLVAVSLGVCAAVSATRATIQEESCIEPDIEYPVPCDDEE